MNLSEQTTTLLRIAGGSTSSGISWKIEFDDYVPLRFQAYDRPLGAGYLRLGNYSTTLVELAVEPFRQVLRGVTITTIDDISPWPDFALSATVDELPIVSTSFEGGEAISLQDKFKVAVRQSEIVVFWGTLARCTAYRCGSCSFLVENRSLAGVLFTELTEKDVGRFASHARYGVPPRE